MATFGCLCSMAGFLVLEHIMAVAITFILHGCR
jgi:hypothetical protein